MKAKPDNATHRIRGYRPADRTDVRDICVETAWMGDPAPDLVFDEWIWSEFWTRYYTDAEPEHAWVVERIVDGRAAGYLVGTADVHRVARYTLRIAPGIVARVLTGGVLWKRETRHVLRALAGGLVRGEWRMPEGFWDEYPATFHFDLRREARGMGFGTAMLRTFLDQMERRGVRGVHVQTMSANGPAQAVFSRLGFERFHESEARAFGGARREPTGSATWVKRLTS